MSKTKTTTEAKVNPIAGIRFRKREIDDLLRNTDLGSGHAKVAHDREGYYVEDPGPVSDPVGEVMRRLLARLREGRSGQVMIPVSRAKPTPSGFPASPPGACAVVRAWAEDHPEATLKEAIESLPDINPVTVRIQFRKVRP